MRKHWPIMLISLVLLVGLGAVCWRLLAINLGASQYAKYSSLRSDPLGTKVLYRAYEAMPEVEAKRWIRPLYMLEPKDSLVVLAGTGQSWAIFSETLPLTELQRLATDGNRVLVCFGEVSSYMVDPEEAEEETKETEEPSRVLPWPAWKKESDDAAEKQEEEPPNPLYHDWGLVLVSHRAVGPACTPAARGLQTPPSWRAELALQLEDEAWTPLVTDSAGAVWMAERSFGRGSIVACADSYWLSNESLAKDRSSDAILWLVGDKATVIFDESRLGVTTQLGVVGLARQYRMHGFAIGLLLVVLLYIWRASAAFLPPDELPADSLVRGPRMDGLTALLRQNIRPRDLLQTCHDAWQRTLRSSRQVPKERATRIKRLCQDELPAKELHTEILQRYKTICRLMAGKD